MLARFKAADVLTAEIRLIRAWPGGPVSGIVVARHGPDAVELGRASVRAASASGVDAMLDGAVRAIDTIYVRALANGDLAVEKGLTVELAPLIGTGPAIGASGSGVAGSTGTEADVATPDAAAWAATFADLRATSGITDVRLLRLSLGAVSRIVIRHGDSDAALAYHLDQRGWRLAPEPGGVLLRRKVAGDPVVPPPPTADEMNNAEVIAEPDADPLAPAAKPRALSPARATAAPRPPEVAKPVNLLPPATPAAPK